MALVIVAAVRQIICLEFDAMSVIASNESMHQGFVLWAKWKNAGEMVLIGIKQIKDTFI